MLLSKDATAAAAETGLSSADFYSPAHGHVYEAITNLVGVGRPTDPVSVADELLRAGLLEAVGGSQALIGLLSSTGAISSAARYARIILDHAQLRRLIQVGTELVDLAYEVPGDVEAAIDDAEGRVFALGERTSSGAVSPIDEVFGRTLDQLEAINQKGSGVTGIPTGYRDLDALLGGLHPSALVIIGARPGMGKTALALGMASHAAKASGRPVLFFSLEMSEFELAQRLLSATARVESERIRRGGLQDRDWERITAAMADLGDAPLFLHDDPHLTAQQVVAKARRLKAREGDLGLVVIDYLQLLTPGRHSAESRQVEVAEMSRALKLAARELQAPVVALSQLSRALETRADKRPVLSDLRESGALEHDADVVAFLYRDELYHRDSPDRGLAELSVAKHRQGPTGEVQLAFISGHTRFANLAKE